MEEPSAEISQSRPNLLQGTGGALGALSTKKEGHEAEAEEGVPIAVIICETEMIQSHRPTAATLKLAQC